MYTPALTSLRITAYHSVVASRVPLIANQGAGGPSIGSESPASSSCRPVATCPDVVSM
ncbi:MAG: hypothetical protein QOF76_1152 [Solirubrobacteraceae bacterium]|nr:hypothetical protein [Solirubrobacteraceae bacterium]